MSLTDIEEEIKMLGTNKFTNSSDTPRKVLKQNVYFFPLDIYPKKHRCVTCYWKEGQPSK